MARVPCRFEACLGTANKRAVTTQLNHRARCLNGASASSFDETRLEDFFHPFIFQFRRKFPIILSRISSFFVSAIDGSLGAGNLAKGNGEIFPGEKRI